MRRLAIIAGLLFSAARVIADPAGPAVAHNAYPLLLPFLSPTASALDSLPAGTFELSAAAAYGNTFHFDPRTIDPELLVDIDAEPARIDLGIRLFLSPDLSVSVGLPIVAAYGGFLDAPIQGFHRLFTFPNADRELVDNNGFRLLVRRGGKTLVDLDEPFVSLADLGLGVTMRVHEADLGGALLRIGADAGIQVPTGAAERFASNGAVDLAAGPLVRLEAAATIAYGGLRYLYHGRGRISDALGFRPHNISGYLAVEQALAGGPSIFVQCEVQTTPYTYNRNWFGPLSGRISAGLCGRTGGGAWHAGFSQEVFGFAALDITLFIAYQWRWYRAAGTDGD